MLLGAITALIVYGINYPLAKHLAARAQTPKDFRTRYYSLGLLGPVLGFVLLALFLTFNPIVYALCSLLTYALVARDVEKKHLKPAAAAAPATAESEAPDGPQQPA